MRNKVCLLFLFSLSFHVLIAQQDSLPNVDILLDLSLEELMNIKVVTASGYMQTTLEAPSTITVSIRQFVSTSVNTGEYRQRHAHHK